MTASDRFSSGEHVFTTTSGSTLQYFVQGKPSAPLLFMIPPAWGPTTLYLRKSCQQADDHYRTIYIEPRGNGQSSALDASEMTTRGCADDVEAVRVYLGIERIENMFGHSNGACIAIDYAKVYPDRVSKIFASNWGVPGTADPTQAAVWARKYEEFPAHRDAIYKLEHFMEAEENRDDAVQDLSPCLRFVLPAYFGDVDAAPVDKFKEWFPDGIITKWKMNCINGADFMTGEPSKQLHSIRAKVLIHASGRDPMFTPLQVRGLKDEMAKQGSPAAGEVEFLVYDQAGHFPWMEEPDRFWQDVRTFFDS